MLPAQLLTAAHPAHQRGYLGCRVWAQAESRCGLLPVVRHRMTARGTQPLVSSAYRFESLYLYGAVEPRTGAHFFLEFPTLTTACFQLFLDHFAALDPAHFHLLLLDNGAFHKARPLCLPANVGLLFFPPYSPELTPLERLWRDLKDWLAPSPPATRDDLSTRLMTRLPPYSAAGVRSLTGFPYLLTATQSANG